MCHYNSNIRFKVGGCAHGKRAVESYSADAVELYCFAESVFANNQVLEWQLDLEDRIIDCSGGFSRFVNVSYPSFLPFPADAAGISIGAGT